MTITLYHHPLSSFSHKVLIALHENGVAFESHIVDFGDKDARGRHFEMWPMGKIPVLRDDSRDRTLPESSIIIEYVEQTYPGVRPLLPADADARLDVRLWDRIFDLYVHVPMQKIVADCLRAVGEHDPAGVADARTMLVAAYKMIDRHMAGRAWAAGESFSLADCAAAPALFYAGIVEPFPDSHRNLAGYFERLLERPSFAGVLAGARPYFHMFPFRDDIPARFLEGDPAGSRD